MYMHVKHMSLTAIHKCSINESTKGQTLSAPTQKKTYLRCDGDMENGSVREVKKDRDSERSSSYIH